MDKLNPTLIIDLVILLILLWKLLQGRRQGIVRRLGSLAAFFCAIFGGRFVQDTYAERFSALLIPKITALLDRARETLGASDLLDNLNADNLNEILAQANLPDFLKNGIAESVTTRVGEALNSAIATASELIAQRLSEWLLFLIAAAVIYAVVKLIFNGILDPIIRKLPIVKSVNRALGAVLGLVCGVLLAGLLLWIAYHLVPELSAPGGALSPAAIEKSWLIRLYFRFFPELFT